VEAVKTGRMTPQPLFTNRFPLEQLQQALEMARDRPDGFLKGLVMM
jgi:threonine dehydrogenase-like Zn-dependent dehydrogenase